MDKYFTVRQVAEIFGITTNTVENWIKQGKIRALNISSPTTPRYRIPQSEISRVAKDE